MKHYHPNSGQVIERIRKMGTEAVRHYRNNSLESGNLKYKNQVSIDLFTACFVGVFSGTVVWWLEYDFLLSPEEITNKFRRLLIHGVGY
jgi:hypothetical protein